MRDGVGSPKTQASGLSNLFATRSRRVPLSLRRRFAMRSRSTCSLAAQPTLHCTFQIANEAGIRLPITLFDELSARTPHISYMNPSGPYTMSDLDAAGGIPAIIKRARMLFSNEMTCSGMTIHEIADSAFIYRDDVIRPLDDPVHTTGGITVLYGNIAPDGAIVKSAGVSDDMLSSTGTARVFNSENDAMHAILSGNIKDCLLYTSDAADDLLCVDLGGRRII